MMPPLFKLESQYLPIKYKYIEVLQKLGFNIGVLDSPYIRFSKENEGLITTVPLSIDIWEELDIPHSESLGSIDNYTKEISFDSLIHLSVDWLHHNHTSIIYTEIPIDGIAGVDYKYCTRIFKDGNSKLKRYPVTNE